MGVTEVRQVPMLSSEHDSTLEYWPTNWPEPPPHRPTPPRASAESHGHCTSRAQKLCDLLVRFALVATPMATRQLCAS